MNRTKQIYDVIEHDNIIMTGTAQQIADTLYTSIWNVKDCCYKKRKMFKKYKIEKKGEKWKR